MSNCTLQYSTDSGYKQCLRCYINEILPSPHRMTLRRNCPLIKDNHCVDLYFNTTRLFTNFSKRFASVMNKLFDKEDDSSSETQNTLFIHIEYDTHDHFSFETFQNLDQIQNRNYSVLSFELKNRDQSLTLQLDNSIKNMTLNSLQINIYCGSKGLYQYNYQQKFNQTLVELLTCEIPTTTNKLDSTYPITTILSTTQQNPYRMVMIFSLISGGSLIPCSILACCLYILCKQNLDHTEYDSERRDSFTSSSNDSIFSDFS